MCTACVCVYTCTWVTCLFSLGASVSMLVCLMFRCVCTLLRFIQLAWLLPLLTWPPLFSCLPDRQYARAPPQSFIGSYCPLTQIQYASIDCVEMQSGSPQQRSKQSKFNKTPPLAFSPALIAPPKEEQMYLCVWREKKGSFKRPWLLLDALLEACEATQAECAGSDLSYDLTSCQVGGCYKADVFGFNLRC